MTGGEHDFGGADHTFEIRPAQSPVSAEERAALLTNPVFGRVFTDHMVTVKYAEGKGWYDARVEQRAPIPMDPATAVLHYAQEIFEGCKAFRAQDGGVTLFRGDQNARRFRDSAARMAMPPLPEELFLGSIQELVSIDRDWVPTDPEGSLYLRPVMFASEVFLGVRPATEYLYVLIASPVGAYFKGGVKPVTVWVSDEYTRAAPGGTGAVKCGGNYAASLVVQQEAIEHGCDQVVYLDAVQRKYVDELGGMNVFFVYDDGELVTPPLSGTILPGIIRDSIITLARESGHAVVEREISFDEWQADAATGRITEMFACGTAAAITPVGAVRSAMADFTMGDGNTGPISAKLRERLVGIQRGHVADSHGWLRRLI